MKKACVFSFVGFLVLFHCSAARPSAIPILSTNLTETLTEKIEPLIEQTMKSYDVPGLALAVAKDGKIVYAKGFGVKDLRSREPITPDSLFHMASVSKTFVATAIVQLLEQGKIQLDDPVRTYLPYFQLKDPRFKQITIRHLLTHTAGLPYLENENRNFDWDRPEYDSGALERYVRRLHEVKMIAAPGEQFSYSDMGFEILGDVIAKVSQQSFSDYVKVQFLPAGHFIPPLDHRPCERIQRRAQSQFYVSVQPCPWAQLHPRIECDRDVPLGDHELESGNPQRKAHPQVVQLRTALEPGARNRVRPKMHRSLLVPRQPS